MGLLLKAAHEKKLTVDQMVQLLYDNPKKIFVIPDQPDAYIELDSDKPYIVGSDGYETKCGWSPFDGWEVYGKVENVALKGKPILQKGRIIV